MDPIDGLLIVEGAQLTWMGTTVDNGTVRPRLGKLVEINALWYNALRLMEELGDRFQYKDKKEVYGRWADQVRSSFSQLFWNPGAQSLFDSVNGQSREGRIRPNQIFAVSLPFSLLPRDKACSVVKVVQQKLLTPYGLRSLTPDDPEYRRTYEGTVSGHDLDYHQGTVSAWLIGPFVDAYLNAFGNFEPNRNYLRSLLESFKGHMREATVGSVSEIFDAEFPHSPRGCGAQAWSVAELLRAYRKVTMTGETRSPMTIDPTTGTAGNRQTPMKSG
jgi:glycogen debranching enzyme